MATMRRLTKNTIGVLKRLREHIPALSFAAYILDAPLAEISTLYIFALDGTGLLIGGYGAGFNRQTFKFYASTKEIEAFFTFSVTTMTVVFNTDDVRTVWHTYGRTAEGLRKVYNVQPRPL